MTTPTQEGGPIGALRTPCRSSMTGTLVLVHTVAPLVDEFARLCRERLPGVTVFHLLDEPLLERIRRRGGGAPEDAERLAGHVALAREVGADVVLVTCSTVSLAVGAIRDRFDVPILRIDDELAVETVRVGGTVAVVATNPTTLDPTRETLLAEAQRVGRAVDLRFRLVDHALAALRAGDGATHDRLVEEAVREEAGRSDVVVLAQASMARVLAGMAGQPAPVPVLSSPVLALAQAAKMLPGTTVPEGPALEVRP